MLAESIVEMGLASSNMLQICSLELLCLTYMLLSNPTVLLLASGSMFEFGKGSKEVAWLHMD
jgi:hypothetical protein